MSTNIHRDSPFDDILSTVGRIQVIYNCYFHYNDYRFNEAQRMPLWLRSKHSKDTTTVRILHHILQIIMQSSPAKWVISNHMSSSLIYQFRKSKPLSRSDAFGTLSSLPTDCFQHMTLFLPVNDICRFQSVNKSWYHLLNSEPFWKFLYQHHYGQDFSSSSSKNATFLKWKHRFQGKWQYHGIFKNTSL